jgi:NAD(P)-dependent dehydrogenase (short-subunit alcohol dehydrogenase family)
MRKSWIAGAAAAGAGVGVAAGVGAGIGASLLFRRRGAELAGATVLITGGSRGLGIAMAREFARQGCRLVLCARDADELRAARQDLEARGAETLAVECDVGDRAQVERMVEQALRHFGRIDVLVNNAGEIRVGPLEAMQMEDFERAMRVMFWGTVYPTMALLPHFRNRGSGRIVNVTSIGGKVAMPHLLPYTCAKFAAVGFSEGLRAELKDTGVRVITIAPGLMRTGSHLNAEFKGEHDREAAWFSVSATLPGVTMSADRAARQIVEATRRGRAEKILGAQANLLARFHGLFPGLTSELLGLVDQWLLPSGEATAIRRGSETGVMRSPIVSAVTILGRLAARRFLQPQAARSAGHEPRPAPLSA